MALGPPGLVAGIGVHHRVVRAVLPRAEGRFAAGDDHHVARDRAGSTAFGRNQIVPAVPLEELGGFQPHAFRLPVGGIPPAVIHLLRRTRRGESVGRQGRDKAVVRVEIAFPILCDDMAGVDAAHVQLDRRAPGAFDLIGRDDIVLALARGVVDVILAVHLAQVGGEDGVVAVLDRPRHGFPVHQVRGMPDQQGGEIGKGRVRHVEVVPVAQDGRVGVIAREDAGLEGRLFRRARGHGKGQQEDGYAVFHRVSF